MNLPTSVIQSVRDNCPTLLIDSPLATAEISLFGGHVLSFKPTSDNRERLWVSPSAIFDAHTAIRGGIPICWPWFGPHSSPGYSAHGYVRNQLWQVNSISDIQGTVTVTLTPTSATGEGLDGTPAVELIIAISHQLTLTLTTINAGNAPFEYTAALHSYFDIDSIDDTEISGVSGEYLDKTRAGQRLCTPEPYHFSEETDRVHLCTAKQVTIHCHQKDTVVISEGHDSLVIWNPWKDKAKALKDMSDNGYQTMVCVETAVTQGKTLQPGERHQLVQVIR